MLSPRALKERVDGGDPAVLVWATGEIAVGGAPEGFTGAALVVSPVTDALKRVSADMVVESPVDRGTVARVEGFVLDAPSVRSLPDHDLSPEELIDVLGGPGREWSLLGVSELPEPAWGTQPNLR